MKAYVISEDDNEFGSLIIFAETRNKARMIARGRYPFEDSEYCDINAKREKAVDSYYLPGHEVIDGGCKYDQQLMFDLGWYQCESHSCAGCDMEHWDLIEESHSNNELDEEMYCNECFEIELNKGLLDHFDSGDSPSYIIKETVVIPGKYIKKDKP